MTGKSLINQQIYDNVQYIREDIANACAQAGRSCDTVRLLAVTKTVEAARINAALRCGITQIGENRVQEFLSKRDELLLDGVEAHLIGHLQTNKVRQIVGKVDMIQSVDSFRLAEAISKRSVACAMVTPILVEVNIGGEEAKSGIAPDQTEDLLGQISVLPGISVKGLMTVPPILQKESEKRQVFSKMYQLFVDIRSKNMDNIDMMELSMGMSGDYREAIREGSTMVRIGSALFGERHY